MIRVRQVPPLFPPSLWNVHESTVKGLERTNNVCEGWNNAFAGQVGNTHPSLWTLVEAVQVDEAGVSTDMLKDARGEPPRKRVKRATHDHQVQLQLLCVDRRDGRKTVKEVLRAFGHSIRLNL